MGSGAMRRVPWFMILVFFLIMTLGAATSDGITTTVNSHKLPVWDASGQDDIMSIVYQESWRWARKFIIEVLSEAGYWDHILIALKKTGSAVRVIDDVGALSGFRVKLADPIPTPAPSGGSGSGSDGSTDAELINLTATAAAIAGLTLVKVFLKARSIIAKMLRPGPILRALVQLVKPGTNPAPFFKEMDAKFFPISAQLRGKIRSAYAKLTWNANFDYEHNNSLVCKAADDFDTADLSAEKPDALQQYQKTVDMMTEAHPQSQQIVDHGYSTRGELHDCEKGWTISNIFRAHTANAVRYASLVQMRGPTERQSYANDVQEPMKPRDKHTPMVQTLLPRANGFSMAHPLACSTIYGAMEFSRRCPRNLVTKKRRTKGLQTHSTAQKAFQNQRGGASRRTHPTARNLRRGPRLLPGPSGGAWKQGRQLG